MLCAPGKRSDDMKLVGPTLIRRLVGSEAWLAGSWALRGWTDGWTDGRTKNLPILQDFVPYWARCPAAAQL